MARLSHPHKVRLARSMMSRTEVRGNISIWDSKNWLNRREVRTGIKGGRNRPLPAHIRNMLRTIQLPKKPEQTKESLISRARNLIGGRKNLPQKVV